MPAPDPFPPIPSVVGIPPSVDDEALRGELIGALDHELRTSLTTVLGALQTMTRPGLAPADPDLAQLLVAAAAQAQRMGRLLDELPGAASPGAGGRLSPAELARLIRETAQAGDEADLRLDLPGDFPPAHLSVAGLRRALAGIFARARGGSGLQVVVTADGRDCRIAITGANGQNLTAPGFVARLLAAMGGRLEAATTAGAPTLCLVFPGAVGGAD
jgi:signal transduction histidine kinase